MKNPREMNERELIQYMANEYVHFYWVKKINRQVALWMLKKKVIKNGMDHGR